MKALRLMQYINIKYSGNQAEFAREFGQHPQHVNGMLKDHFVIDGILYKKSKFQQTT